MDQSPPELVDCPTCGVKNAVVQNHCSACGKPLAILILPRPKVRRAGLGSVMIFIAVLAVCLAPVRVAPGLTAVMAIVLVPAALRGLIAIERRRLDDRPARAVEAVAILLHSFFIVAAIGISAVTAFCATCIPIGFFAFGVNSAGAMYVALGVGTITGLLALYFTCKRYWPEKD
jgi:hypothetical protein